MKMGIVKFGLAAGLLICLVVLASGPVLAMSIKEVSVPAVCGGTEFEYSVAVADNGSVWAWGSNVNGVLGPNAPPMSFVPVEIDISNVAQVAAGSNGYVLALKNDGTVWGWGRDYDGSLESISGQSILSPIQITGVSNVVSIAAGFGSCYAIESDGTLWAWGDNTYGQLGIGNTSSVQVDTPVQVNIDNVKEVACAFGATFVLENDGTVRVAGSGEEGLFGNGENCSSDTFVQVPITNVTAISCGYGHILALKNDGTVWSWGYNGDYETGNFSNYDYQSVPTQVLDLDDVVAVSAGGTHSLALKSDGTVWVWGSGNMCTFGLGDFSDMDSMYPLQVTGLDNVTAISAGFFDNFAIKSDGTLWGWGTDDVGAVGVGALVPNTSGDYSPYTWGVSVVVPTQILFDQPDRQYYPYYPPIATPTPVPAVNATSPNSSNATIIEQQNVSSNVQYIAASDNGTIYEFINNTILCYDSTGQLKWNLTIPSQWSICNELERPIDYQITSTVQTLPPQPIYDISDGYLYLYAPSNTGNTSCDLIAISPSGEIAWEAPLKTDLTAFDDTAIKAQGGRIYVFHCYNETVFDTNGNEMFDIPNVADPAAVDENGNLYVTEAVSDYWSVNEYYQDGLWGYYDYRTPSSIVDAYNANGSLLWSKNTGQPIESQYVVESIRPEYDSLPLYQNGTLYVLSYRSVTALGTNDSVKWTKSFDGNGYYLLFDLMPLDNQGNLYLEYLPINGEASGNVSLYVIGPDGNEVCPPRPYTDNYSSLTNEEAGYNGILYEINTNGTAFDPLKPLDNESLYTLPTGTITAYDIIDNKDLWSYQIPQGQEYETTINEYNALNILGLNGDDVNLSSLTPNNASITGIESYTMARVLPVNGTIYVSFTAANVEQDIILGVSKCVYSSGIYALNSNGVPILENGTASYDTQMAANNSSVFFLNENGKVSIITIGVASGIALIAVALIMFKFIGIGSVTRARSRIDKNDNRNAIYQYIVENPGVTMYDVSKALNANIGTVRYHLLILGLNHRIATFKDDTKYIRYFPNSNRYSKQEQLLVAMMRRDAVKRVIQLLFMKPGLMNSEIAGVTGIVESGLSRYMKELCDKGIVIKSEVTPGRYAYSLTEEASKNVEKLYWVMNDEGKVHSSTSGNAAA